MRKPMRLIVQISCAAIWSATFAWAHPDSSHDLEITGHDHALHHLERGTHDFYFNILICVILVLVAGLMSGLTVGLSSIDPLKLNIFSAVQVEEDAGRLEKLKSILSYHHWMLVTLLLANSVAMEALPLFLEKMMPQYLSVILSVTVVLIFGEILPQAICTKNPIPICAMCTPVIWFTMYALGAISYPLGKLLDLLLGEDSAHVLFKQSELQVLFDMYGSQGGNDDKNTIRLDPDTIKILKAATRFGTRRIGDISFTPAENIIMLSYDRSVLVSRVFCCVIFPSFFISPFLVFCSILAFSSAPHIC